MPRSKPTPLVLALMAVSLGAAACQKPPAPTGQPLATLGDQVLVTTDELQAELRNRSPTVHSAEINNASKRDLLDKLIRFELLYREAAREGLETDDEVQRQLKKAMLNRFVQHELDQDPRATTDTDAELMAYYDKHKADYAKPARLRLLVIEVKPHGSSTGVPPEILKAIAELNKRGGSAAAFSALAREVSVDARTRQKGGDTDWASREDLVGSYGDTVVQAAEKLQPDQTSAPVSGKEGWYLVRLAGRQEASNPTFEQIKPTLKARSFHDKRAAMAQAYEDDLRKRSHVEIDEQVLAKVDPLHLGDEKPDLDRASPKK